MNFFGHAVVAAWVDRKPGHLLGSMLPDFEAMVRVPLVAVRDESVQRGIDLHHRTDDAFHRAPRFLGLTSSALQTLTELGVRRGTARAVSHIATEMFIDGALAEDPVHVSAYLTALSSDAGSLDWEDGGHAYARLVGRLSTWGAPMDYQNPSFVLARLRDALRGRPALAIGEDDVERVAKYLAPLQRRVLEEARELLGEVRDALGFDD